MFFLLLLIQIFVFGALALLLRQILTHKITGATTHLQQLSRDYTKKEEQATKRLEEVEQYYKETRAKAQKEINQLKAQFEKETQEAKDKIFKQAHIESEEIVRRANKAKQVILSEIEDRIAKEAIEKACELVEDVLPGQFKLELHSGWVDDLIENGFKQMSKLHIGDDITEAKVISALPLEENQHSKLSQKLEFIFKKDITVKEEVDPKVVAGIVITIGNLVLDGSLRGKIREKIKHAGK